MGQNLPPSTEESSLLAALCRTDLTAWCFLPFANSAVPYCSKAFLQLWKIDDWRSGKPPTDSLTKDSMASALEAQGIEASQFFALVADTGEAGSPPILLVRKDSLKVHAEVSRVTSSQVVIGHLIRFRELVEANVIDAVLREISDARRRLEVLSPREQEILTGICDGQTNKAISIAAAISEKTVEKHRSRIMQKLRLNNSAELFRLASRAMILSELDQAPELNRLSVSLPVHASVGVALVPPH